MFDTLKCDYPLPRDGANGLEYQTKSLGPGYDDYYVSEQGFLLRCEWDVDELTSESWSLVKFTGAVQICALPTDDLDSWVGWTLQFVEGILQPPVEFWPMPSYD